MTFLDLPNYSTFTKSII